MTRDQAQAAMLKHGTQRAAAAALCCSRDTLQRALNRVDNSEPKRGRPLGKTTTYGAPVQGGGVRSLAEFKNTYDLETIVPKRVEQTFRQMGGGWLYEAEFVKEANVTSAQLSMFRDRYADHIVSVRDSRRIWVGKTAIAEEMRRML